MERAERRRRARAEKKAQQRKAKQSLSSFFGPDELVSGQVIRSTSGGRYLECASIPFDDREILASTDDVSPEEAEGLCDDYEADIAAGRYPGDSRVTVFEPFEF